MDDAPPLSAPFDCDFFAESVGNCVLEVAEETLFLEDFTAEKLLLADFLPGTSVGPEVTMVPDDFEMMTESWVLELILDVGVSVDLSPELCGAPVSSADLDDAT